MIPPERDASFAADMEALVELYLAPPIRPGRWSVSMKAARNSRRISGHRT